jgi:2-dehydro-3-deoxyphosphogluconate aldolase/(4S)-4-hydroxy-2-oxoglutarate aldolase
MTQPLSRNVDLRLSTPVVGILRGIDPIFFGEVMGAAFSAGLQALEVTMNTERAVEIVGGQRTRVPAGKFLGMGTIRNKDEAKRAVAAGAMFLVTPNCNIEVIDYARSAEVPVIVGALTPTEVYAAWSAGAAMVKVFPCGAMGGPQYLRDLRGPFEQVKMVAVGGVTGVNVGDYFAAGAFAVGVSSALFGNDFLRQKNPEQVAASVRHFLASCPAN